MQWRKAAGEWQQQLDQHQVEEAAGRGRRERRELAALPTGDGKHLARARTCFFRQFYAKSPFPGKNSACGAPFRKGLATLGAKSATLAVTNVLSLRGPLSPPQATPSGSDAIVELRLQKVRRARAAKFFRLWPSFVQDTTTTCQRRKKLL